MTPVLHSPVTGRWPCRGQHILRAVNPLATGGTLPIQLRRRLLQKQTT